MTPKKGKICSLCSRGLQTVLIAPPGGRVPHRLSLQKLSGSLCATLRGLSFISLHRRENLLRDQGSGVGQALKGGLILSVAGENWRIMELIIPAWPDPCPLPRHGQGSWATNSPVRKVAQLSCWSMVVLRAQPVLTPQLRLPGFSLSPSGASPGPAAAQHGVWVLSEDLLGAGRVLQETPQAVKPNPMLHPMFHCLSGVTRAGEQRKAPCCGWKSWPGCAEEPWRVVFGGK